MSSTDILVTPHAHNFGAAITGVDLSAPLHPDVSAQIRQAWLAHQVVYFPGQPLTHTQLERFTQSIGEYGFDPYVKPVDGHNHILEIRREPNEAVSPFGGSWHSDWSFQATPPSATILHAKVIPPIGGDTHYADGFRAYDKLDAGLRREVEQLNALHSARRPYSHEGFERTGGRKRSMTILPDDNAWDIQAHPIVRTHPESGRRALWVNPVYSIAVEGLSESDSQDLLSKLFEHALRDEFIYKHKWAANMLTMWDNRSVQHCAQGGYDGHLRVLHRTTTAGDAPH